jgi:CRP-like cAMP-binding protein
MLDTSRFDLVRVLSVQSLFAEVDPSELYRLAQGSQLRRYARGEIIVRQSDACEALHIVLTGQVKLYVVSRAGQEKVVELVAPGGSFCESLLFQQPACLATAQATSDTLLLSVQRATVLEEIQQSTGLALRMLGVLSRRLNGLMSELQAQSLKSGRERVADYLLRCAREQGAAQERAVVDLPASKATVASLLAITPEYFSRVLTEFVQEGLITVERRAITLLDKSRLETCEA